MFVAIRRELTLNSLDMFLKSMEKFVKFSSKGHMPLLNLKITMMLKMQLGK